MKRMLIHAAVILVAMGAGTVAAQNSDPSLGEAVMFSDRAAVERLLRQGADANHRESDRPMLVWAAQSGDPGIVELLLDAGADVDAADGLGNTALMRAVALEHTQVVQALLAAGADTGVADDNGNTLAHLALRSDRSDLVSLLVRAGAGFDRPNTEGITPVLELLYSSSENAAAIVRILGRAGVDLDQGSDYYTPLYFAVEQGDERMVDALLIAGADPNRATAEGSLPLIAAASSSYILGSLLAIGADPNVVDKYGETPLFAVIDYGGVEDLELLLDAGADPTHQSTSGQSVLQRAEAQNREEMVSLLAARIGQPAVSTDTEPEPIADSGSKVADESGEFPMLQPSVAMDTPDVGLSYFSSATLPELLTFYKALFDGKGWTEESFYTDEQLYASGSYRHEDEAWSFSLSLDTSAEPARVMVSITAHGNLSAADLPRYPGSSPTYEGDTTTIYTSSDDVMTVSAETLRLLRADGWQGDISVNTESMQQLALGKDKIALTVMVSIAPAQNNRTSVQYSLLRTSR